MTSTTSSTAPDFTTIRGKQRAVWSSGDYAVIGTSLQIVGETLCEAIDVEAGDRVLDIAAGNGNVSLAAARRGADVTASDYVPDLLEGAAQRARADGLKLSVLEAAAESLPVDDSSYDVVLSTFGVMFAPDQETAAAEMVRVVRPGGRIGLANWTPGSFVGRMLRTVTRYVPPPTGVRSPIEWGKSERVAELFGTGVTGLQTTERAFVFRYRSAEDWLEVFRSYYGPVHKAFGALEPAQQDELERELLDLANECNTSTTGRLRVPSEYLEIVATVG